MQTGHTHLPSLPGPLPLNDRSRQTHLDPHLMNRGDDVLRIPFWVTLLGWRTRGRIDRIQQGAIRDPIRQFRSKTPNFSLALHNLKMVIEPDVRAGTRALLLEGMLAYAQEQSFSGCTRMYIVNVTTCALRCSTARVRLCIH